MEFNQSRILDYYIWNSIRRLKSNMKRIWFDIKILLHAIIDSKTLRAE